MTGHCGHCMVTGGRSVGRRLWPPPGWDWRLRRLECVFNWSPTRDSAADGHSYDSDTMYTL